MEECVQCEVRNLKNAFVNAIYNKIADKVGLMQNKDNKNV